MPGKLTAKPTVFDSGRWKNSLIGEPKYRFGSQSVAEAKRWQKQVRARFIKALGGFPTEHAPLKPKILDREEFEDYTRESVAFQSRAGLNVFGYFLTPKGAMAPLPTLLCVPGHGYGVDAIVGLDAYGEPQKEPEYQSNFALQAVRNGYAVLAVEVLGFGRRREGEFEPGSHNSSCQTLTGAAFMLGQSMAGWRVYDSIRAVDYLETRPEVDSSRIGIMGISGGGLVSLFSGAVDERIKATMVSGFLNTFRDSVMGVPHCIDNFVPGLALDVDMSDIAGLIAPRALWCENGTVDTIFPLAAFKRAVRNVKKIYGVFGAPASFGSEVFEGEHQFYGVGSWPFLEKHLK